MLLRLFCSENKVKNKVDDWQIMHCCKTKKCVDTFAQREGGRSYRQHSIFACKISFFIEVLREFFLLKYLGHFGNRPIAAKKNNGFDTVGESPSSECSVERLECSDFSRGQLKVGHGELLVPTTKSITLSKKSGKRKIEDFLTGYSRTGAAVHDSVPCDTATNGKILDKRKIMQKHRHSRLHRNDTHLGTCQF